MTTDVLGTNSFLKGAPTRPVHLPPRSIPGPHVWPKSELRYTKLPPPRQPKSVALGFVEDARMVPPGGMPDGNAGSLLHVPERFTSCVDQMPQSVATKGR